jgi:hypothetical protein
MMSCNCEGNGLPYVGQLIRQDDIFYGVYCMLCGNCESIDWTEEEAVMNWNKEQTLKQKGIKVFNEEQYDAVVKHLNSPHRVAHEPQRVDLGEGGKGNILLEEFPFIVQLVWKPLCGHYIRAYHKKTVHCKYIEYDEKDFK